MILQNAPVAYHQVLPDPDDKKSRHAHDDPKPTKRTHAPVAEVGHHDSRRALSDQCSAEADVRPDDPHDSARPSRPPFSFRENAW
jgi:hypothetical protein